LPADAAAYVNAAKTSTTFRPPTLSSAAAK
jgi:hypothetical protein